MKSDVTIYRVGLATWAVKPGESHSKAWRWAMSADSDDVFAAFAKPAA